MVYQTIDYSGLVILLAFLLVFLYAVLMYFVIGKSKSKLYRELLADMYVVGIIKQLATKDSVDLHKELTEFDRIIKKSNLRTKGLSQVIEDELKEKVSDTQEKTLSTK